MSLVAIRSYFVDRILEVSPDFKEHTDAFNTENIPANALDKAFHVLCNGLSGESLDHVATNDTVSVQVRLFFRGGRDPISSLNEAQDLANSVRLQAMKPTKIKLLASIRRVFCQGFQPTALATNDNSFSILLNFTVQTGFSLAAA